MSTTPPDDSSPLLHPVPRPNPRRHRQFPPVEPAFSSPVDPPGPTWKSIASVGFPLAISIIGVLISTVVGLYVNGVANNLKEVKAMQVALQATLVAIETNARTERRTIEQAAQHARGELEALTRKLVEERSTALDTRLNTLVQALNARIDVVKEVLQRERDESIKLAYQEMYRQNAGQDAERNRLRDFVDDIRNTQNQRKALVEIIPDIQRQLRELERQLDRLHSSRSTGHGSESLPADASMPW